MKIASMYPSFCVDKFIQDQFLLGTLYTMKVLEASVRNDRLYAFYFI